MRATTSPTCTVAPSWARTVMRPPLGAGISTLALSVSSSNSGSSAATVSPVCLSQRTITPSEIDSPRAGICTSTAMRFLQRAVDQLRLLALVHLVRADCRAGGFVATDVAQRAIAQYARQAQRHELPGAHVPWLFLHPGNLAGAGVGRDGLLNFLARQRIELLDADDGHVFNLALVAAREQVVVDLAAAQQHAPHARCIEGGGFGQHGAE